MRKLVLTVIFCAGVFYAPLPLIAQNGGGNTPLIPVADMPADSGGATAPSEPPLEVDPQEAPELLPPQEVGGGAEAPAPRETAPAPSPTPEPAPAPAPVPAPEPAPEPTASVAIPSRPADAGPAQNPDEPTDDEEPSGTAPDEAPTAPGQEENNQDEEQFEEEFDDVPEAGEPNAPSVAPQATAGPQLPRTGADLPALLLSGLALTASGISLRALVRTRS
jgi:hypothetical protein